MMKLSNSKGEKFNLLQEHADPLRSFEVEQAYRFPIHYLTISKQLQKTVFQYANKIVPIIPNGLDRKEFFLAVPIELREPLSIIMLYSEDPGKGTMYGLQALEQVVNKYPDLRVTLFGIYTQPQDLPAYCSYHQSPNNLAALYNQSAIFITPSLQEGWGWLRWRQWHVDAPVYVRVLMDIWNLWIRIRLFLSIPEILLNWLLEL